MKSILLALLFLSFSEARGAHGERKDAGGRQPPPTPTPTPTPAAGTQPIGNLPSWVLRRATTPGNLCDGEGPLVGGGNYFAKERGIKFILVDKKGDQVYPKGIQAALEHSFEFSESPDGKRVAVFVHEGGQRIARILAMPEGTVLTQFPITWKRRGQLSPDGRFIVLPGSQVTFYEVATGERFAEFDLGRNVHSIRFCSSGNFVAGREGIHELIDTNRLIHGSSKAGAIAQLARDVDSLNAERAWEALAHLKDQRRARQELREALAANAARVFGEKERAALASLLGEDGLGNQDFNLREEAEQRILQLVGSVGPTVYRQKIAVALETATKSSDAEIARRARSLLADAPKHIGHADPEVLESRIRYLDQ